MKMTAPDLRKNPPRSGRQMLGGYAFLARAVDKARALHAGSIGDYSAYCPFTMGFLERTGVSRDEFEKLILKGADDEELVRYFDLRVSDEDREAANRWVLEDMKAPLDKEDKEEGRG